MKLLPKQQMLSDQHIEALVRGSNSGNVEQLCLALRLQEPQWLPKIRRALEDSGHDNRSLSDRLRSAQLDADASQQAPVATEGFLNILKECGVTFAY